MAVIASRGSVCAVLYTLSAAVVCSEDWVKGHVIVAWRIVQLRTNLPSSATGPYMYCEEHISYLGATPIGCTVATDFLELLVEQTTMVVVFAARHVDANRRLADSKMRRYILETRL